MRNGIVCLLTLWITAAISVTIADTYTLDELLKEGISNSKALRSVEEEMRKAQSQINEAYGNALPSISASVNVSHAFETYNPYSMGAPDTAGMISRLTDSLTGIAGREPSIDDSLVGALGRFGAAISVLTMREMGAMFPDLSIPDNSAAMSLTLSQPLFAQGKVSVGLKIAKSYQAMLICKHYDEKMKLKASIIKLFYASLLAQKGIEIQNEAVRIASETHRLSVVRQAIGKGTELDTLVSRLHVENAKISLQKAGSDKRMAHEALIMASGIATNASAFSVQGEFPPAQFDLSLDTALATTFKENTTIKQMQGAGSIQEQLVRLAKTDFLPLVYAGASVSKIAQFDGLSELGDEGTWGDDRKVFVGLSWNIFSGLKRMNKVSQAKSDQEIFRLARKQAIEGIELATRNAYEHVVISRDRLGMLSRLVSLAEKGHRVAQKSYEVGSSTLLDVQNAGLELNKAQIAHNAALLEFSSALADLQMLMGVL